MPNPATIEDVVEKLAMAITHSEQGEYAKNEAFVRTILQSQADQYEREKGEMAKELFKVLEYLNTERELNAEQHERMGIKLALQEFKLRFAQKYGVDTQSLN
jgi:hypothetical protein